MTGKGWREMKTTCKTKNCFHWPPPGKDYCGPCWKLMQQCTAVPDPDGESVRRSEGIALEDAGIEKELGA